MLLSANEANLATPRASLGVEFSDWNGGTHPEFDTTESVTGANVQQWRLASLANG
jgi:hypothetical protein